MTILTKYILREFSKVFFYSLAVAVSLFFIFDLFERLDDFLKFHAQIGPILQYFLFKFPPIIFQITPVAVLLATFIVLGMLSRNFEIIALRTSGISLFRTISPILGSALLISIITLFGNELISPLANQKAKAISNEIKGRKGKYLFNQNQLWYRGEAAIFNIKFFSPQDNILHGVTLYFFDHDFHLLKRIDAEKAEWQGKQWIFHNVITRVFGADKTIKTSLEPKKVFPLKEGPEIFKQEIREPEEMSYIELKGYIEKTTQEGYDTTKYLADMYTKLSSPFINFIISLFGIPFALRIGKHGGFALGVTASFVVGFLYWVFFNLCLALGHSGAFHPLISAWVANFIFGTLGLYLLLQIRY